jgi:hypothetical protein
MNSRSTSRRLGVMALILTLAGPAGRLAAADAALPQSVTRAQFEAWFKEISNWGRWGKDDELGTLNLITPEKRKAAAALVRDGVSVSLALELNKTADAFNTNPFEQALTVGEFGGHAVAEDRYAVRYHGFAHSHIDGLTHFAHAGTLYNGVSVDVLEKGGARKLGIENAKDGIFTREGRGGDRLRRRERCHAFGRRGPGQSAARAGAGESRHVAPRQPGSGPTGPRSAAAGPLDVSVRRLTAPRSGRRRISAEPNRDFLSGGNDGCAAASWTFGGRLGLCSPIYRCHTGLAQRCAGPISIFATPRFRAAAGQNPCGTFIESRTGSQAMATLQYRMFGLAALGNAYTQVDR